MSFAYHNLIGGPNFPIIQVPAGDPVFFRIGDGTPCPIGFTRNELDLLIAGVKSWAPSATAFDASGGDLTPQWWNNGDAYQLPLDILPNNNVWSVGSLNGAFQYPWGGYSTTVPYFDAQEKYPISTGLGLLHPVGVPMQSVDAQISYGQSFPIYFDGTLYWPQIIVRFRNSPNDLYASTSQVDLASNPTISGTCTIMGKTCNIWWDDVPPNVGTTSFNLDIQDRW